MLNKDSTTYYLLSRLKQLGVRPVFKKGIVFVPGNEYADSIFKSVPCSKKEWNKITVGDIERRIETRTVHPNLKSV